MRIVILSEPAVAGKSKDLNALICKDHPSSSIRTYYALAVRTITI
jgi:hypothetical protein